VVVNAIDADFANGDVVVIGDGVAGAEEYVQVGFRDDAAGRIRFRAPLRSGHDAGRSIQEATLSFRRQGVQYTLTPATGAIQPLGAAFGAGNAIVMNYRAGGASGWFRGPGDPLQALYVPPINDSPDLDATGGGWSGLALLDGTCSASIRGRKNQVLGLQNEMQTYNGIGEASTVDLLFGAATAIELTSIITSGASGEQCHTMVGPFHGGNRRDFNPCVLCHGAAGSEDWPTYATTPANLPTTGDTINLRTMLHKLHRGAGSCVVCQGEGASQAVDVVHTVSQSGAPTALELGRKHGVEVHLKARMAPAATDPAAAAVGAPQQLPPGEIVGRPPLTTCLQCHNETSPSFKPFCFKQRYEEMGHLDPRRKRSKAELDSMKCGCGEGCKCRQGECGEPLGGS